MKNEMKKRLGAAAAAVIVAMLCGSCGSQTAQAQETTAKQETAAAQTESTEKTKKTKKTTKAEEGPKDEAPGKSLDVLGCKTYELSMSTESADMGNDELIEKLVGYCRDNRLFEPFMVSEPETISFLSGAKLDFDGDGKDEYLIKIGYSDSDMCTLFYADDTGITSTVSGFMGNTAIKIFDYGLFSCFAYSETGFTAPTSFLIRPYDDGTTETIASVIGSTNRFEWDARGFLNVYDSNANGSWVSGRMIVCTTDGELMWIGQDAIRVKEFLNIIAGDEKLRASYEALGVSDSDIEAADTVGYIYFRIRIGESTVYDIYDDEFKGEVNSGYTQSNNLPYNISGINVKKLNIVNN